MSITRKKRRRRMSLRGLALWRQAHGFGQREEADYLGISQSYFSKLERYAVAQRRNIAKQLMARTGIPVEELMGITE